MRLPALLAASAFFLLSVATAVPSELDRYLSRLAPRADGRQAFGGKIEAFDPAAKTITLRLGSSLVFHLTSQTTISDPTGPVAADQIKVGEGATIVMRPGQNGARMALTIKLDHRTSFPSATAAHTAQGKTIVGLKAMEFVLTAPPQSRFLRGSDFGKREGLFGLTVLPDGTVASVQVITSLGIRESDKRAENWLKRWKFQPNGVKEFQMPVSRPVLGLY